VFCGFEHKFESKGRLSELNELAENSNHKWQMGETSECFVVVVSSIYITKTLSR